MRLASISLALAATASSLVLVTGAASAASAATGGHDVRAASRSVSATITEQSAAGTAPACIRRSNSNLLKQVVVSNGCTTTMRVKVIIRVGPDSGCWTMPRGDVRYHNYVGYYQKVVTC